MDQPTGIPSKQSITSERWHLPAGMRNSVMSMTRSSLGAAASKWRLSLSSGQVFPDVSQTSPTYGLYLRLLRGAQATSPFELTMEGEDLWASTGGSARSRRRSGWASQARRRHRRSRTWDSATRPFHAHGRPAERPTQRGTRSGRGLGAGGPRQASSCSGCSAGRHNNERLACAPWRLLQRLRLGTDARLRPHLLLELFTSVVCCGFLIRPHELRGVFWLYRLNQWSAFRTLARSTPTSAR